VVARRGRGRGRGRGGGRGRGRGRRRRRRRRGRRISSRIITRIKERSKRGNIQLRDGILEILLLCPNQHPTSVYLLFRCVSPSPKTFYSHLESLFNNVPFYPLLLFLDRIEEGEIETERKIFQSKVVQTLHSKHFSSSSFNFYFSSFSCSFPPHLP
jgi:hypothetical protein